MSTLPISSTSQDFLSKLKTQTASSHKKLESLPVSMRIVSPALEIEGYTHYLSLMYPVHKNLEERIFPLLSPLIDTIKVREKSQLITEDLSFLNCTYPVSRPVFEDFKYTIPFALGIMYVVEGSTLGGRYILKNIETIPGLNDGKGVSYFTGYGTETGRHWKSLLNVITQYEQEHNCEYEIIAGAQYAFDSIYSHFLMMGTDEN